MKRTTRILGTATVIGLLAVPIANAYDDWITPGLWQWVLDTGAPSIAALEGSVEALEDAVAALSTGQVHTAKFVGFSDAAVFCSVGIKGMNEACVAKFGSNARFANSKDLIDGKHVDATSPFSHAWIRPMLLNAGSDYSGIVDEPDRLNCNGWTIDSRGLMIITSTYSFAHGAPGAMERPVACSVIQ
jgi:hypothetical protein